MPKYICDKFENRKTKNKNWNFKILFCYISSFHNSYFIYFVHFIYFVYLGDRTSISGDLPSRANLLVGEPPIRGLARTPLRGDAGATMCSAQQPAASPPRYASPPSSRHPSEAAASGALPPARAPRHTSPSSFQWSETAVILTAPDVRIEFAFLVLYNSFT